MDKFLQNNAVIKGLAFLLAFMLWMVVTLDEQPGSTVQEGHLSMDNVKVEAVYDEELYEIMEMDYEAVQVLLTGRRALLNLNMLRADPYRVYVDLTGLSEGRHRLPVKHEGFPSELRVEIIPRFINVVIEKKEVKSFPFEIEVTGKPKEGYTVEQPKVRLDQVHVIASTTVLDRVAVVKGYVDVDRVDQSFVDQVTLRAFDRYGNELKAEVSPNEVEVSVPVKSPSKKVPFSLKLENSLPSGLSLISVELSDKEIEVFAAPKVLEKLTRIEGTLDLSKITSSTTIQYTVSKDREWQEITPKVIDIEVKVGTTQKREFLGVPIEVIGLSESYEIQFLEPTNGKLDIELLGSKEQLELIQLKDIRTSIDVSQLGPGQHNISVILNLPEHIRTSFVNRIVKVNIRPIEEVQETSGNTTEEEEIGGE
ncbi:CdaR family protein [Caldalkalibacillus mannanilyticus]|uniref:CdaR family protein n=1 Tax=Caldalkalibacillus mannanilyticus TaxID=1418 RepID=UPI0004682EFC|nr:CdaR family protein [Caldalkalibacillus mannanilyticus]